MPKSLIRLAGALFLVAIGHVASPAGDREVIQKDKQFSEESLEIAVGDSIRFKNEDVVVHNLFSKEFDFNITQNPGDETPVVFDKAGATEIRCVIHPKMKLKVRVVE